MSTEVAEVKEIKHYLAHPEDLPTTDPAAMAKIEALMAGAAGDVTAMVADNEPAAEIQPVAQPEPEPLVEKPVILARDGKNTIPYSELEQARKAADDARVAREAAERVASEREQQIIDLRQRLESAQPSEKIEKIDLQGLSEEELEAMRTEAPLFYKMYEQQQAVIAQLQASIKQVEGGVAQARQREAVDDAVETQDLIDQVPELKGWQEKAPYLFARAQEVEAALLADTTRPELRTNDLARYQEVAKVVRQEIGLPAAAPTGNGSSTSTTDDLAARAARAVEQLGAPLPHSLSDIKGGNAPAQSTLEEVERMSSTDLANRLSSMTPAQQEAFLARLA